MSKNTYRVECEDCEMSEEYQAKKQAVLDMVSHAKQSEHAAVVIEPSDE